MNQEAHFVSVVDFYKKAKDEAIDYGYSNEIGWATKVRFDKQTLEDFKREYIWVVCNSGMRNQVAEKIFHRFMKSGDLSIIGHPHKRKSIEQLLQHGDQWFHNLQQCETVDDKLTYLDSLPHIGPITKYHLAKNLGIQVAKPDRHLVRLARFFNFKTPQELCEYVSKETGDNIITVDVIMWRYGNLFGTKFAE